MVIMKRYLITPSLSLAAMLWSSVLITGAFAQDGSVAFANGPTTLITYSSGPGTAEPLPANVAGSFYFGLMISTNATGPFTFTGVYATNGARAGRIAGYVTSVPGWPQGTVMFYDVAGWSASLGATFDPAWLTGNFDGMSGYFGMSSVTIAASGCSGPPTCTAPAWNLFGGSGLGSFNLLVVNPLILDTGPSFGVQTNQFGFTVSWATNRLVTVEACTDLSSLVWSPLQTITLTNGSAFFSDTQWTNHPGRFYRLRSP
jgi:hypothetical protein